ncbi:MAG: protein kinase, partial [Lachnospiraceae bacterium]|nr:protein kinase [Lachnospiraceae bacterium]
MRQALEEGKKYILHNEDVPERVFYITKVIGYGASCIVYDGYYRDDMVRHYVRIKECFSEYYAEDERASNMVVWKSEEAKAAAFEKWKRAFHMQLIMQEKYELVNSTSALIDKMYMGNNTLYMIMAVDNGKTYDELEPEFKNIHEILCTIDALAEVVGRYHREGFLHLDIKPQNFLVLPGRHKQVKLFDFDSFVSMDDIQEGMVEHISYSGEWAAPEVRQGRIHKISEASDIYSLGMILYVTLLGRQRELEEQVASRKMDLSSCAWLEGTNPLLKKKLECFLEKMIAVAISNRYQNITQVSQELRELLKLSDPERMYLCKRIPKQLSCFVGRKSELKQVQGILEEKQVVLVHGISGVGKSEFSRRFAYIYREAYSNVVWLKCQGSMAATIMEDDNLTIANCQQKRESYQKKLAVLKTVVDSDTLFILDDIRDFSEPALLDFLELNCRFLITTKNYVSDLREQYPMFSLECMADEELEELFYFNYTRQLATEEKWAVRELIHQKLGNYTLYVPLLAKQMKNSGLLPSQMLKLLEKEGLKISLQENITHQKDEMVVYDNFYPMVRYFLELVKLSPEEEMVLKVISYFEPFHVGRRELARWCGLVSPDSKKLNLEPINQLVQKGWLFWEESLDRISIHTVFREMVVSEYQPFIMELQPMQERLKQLIGEMKWYNKSNYHSSYANRLKDMVEPSITKSYYDVKQCKYLILHMLSNQKLDTTESLRYVIQICRELYFDAPDGEITRLMEKVIRQAATTEWLTEEEMACAYYVMIRNERLQGLMEAIDYALAIEHLKQAVEYGKRVKYWNYFKDYDDYCRELSVEDYMDDLYLWILQDFSFQNARAYYDALASVLKNAHGTEKEVSMAEEIGKIWAHEDAISRLADSDTCDADFSVIRKTFPPLAPWDEEDFMLFSLLKQTEQLSSKQSYACLWAFDNFTMSKGDEKLKWYRLSALADRLQESGLAFLGVLVYFWVQGVEDISFTSDRNNAIQFLKNIMHCSESIGCKESYEMAEHQMQQLVAIDFSGEKKKTILEDISISGLKQIADYMHQIVTLKDNKEKLLKEIHSNQEIPAKYKEFLLSALQN